MKKTFLEMVKKFNPYHDKRGRFTTAGGATSMTYAPGKSKAHDNAIAREKERMARIMPTEAQSKTLKTIENKTRNLKKEQYRVVDREGNVVLHKQGDRHSVSKTVGEAREHLPGNITIHNHPDGGTFSTVDLKDFGFGATEIRAATPEGTYMMRNVVKYGKPSHNQKTWLEMQEDLEVAAESFKTNRELKKEIRQSYDKQLQPMVEKWTKAKEAGAPMEELQRLANEYTAKAESFRPQIEADTRKAYVEQYHKWYRTHAGEYGFEYEFTPVKTKAQKMVEEVITKAVDTGEIVHDQDIADDVKEIANDIIESLKRMLMVEKANVMSFSDAIEKFNPYHDKLGRFTTASGATSFTWRTKDSSKQRLADKATEREKQLTAASMPTEAQLKTITAIENRTRNLKREQLRVVDRDGNVILEKKGGKSSVSYTVTEALKTFDGNVIVHNHPDPSNYGGSFSIADLTVIAFGATEIRAAAPEGTYILRNRLFGHRGKGKDVLAMEKDLTDASEEFKRKTVIDLEVRQRYNPIYAERVSPLGQKVLQARSRGASEEEIKRLKDAHIKAADEWNKEFKPKIQREIRQTYVDQYHEWFKKNAYKYGMEYEFIPTKTITKKGFDEIVMKSANEENAVDADVIVLDKQMNDDIRELTDKIMAEITESAESIEKFNPYHDKRGRFTTANGATSFTYRTKDSSKQHLADKAISRAKESADNEQKGRTYKLYHGSPNANIESLDIKHAGANTSSGEKLLFFTDNKDFADEFAYERLPGSSRYMDKKGKYGRVYEVEVNLKNPLDFRDLTDKDIDNILKLDVDGILTADEVKELAGKNHQLLKSNLDMRAERLKELGYDGMIARARKDGTLEYAVVSNEQATIQKANPYHDPKNGRFTFAPSGSAATSSMKNSDGEQLSDAQARYFADSKAVDENGNLVKLYHGTVHDFTEFDKSRLQPDSDLGAGIYLTNSADDGNKHYGNELGPDLLHKINNMTERLTEEGMEWSEAEQLAKETFVTSEPKNMECYVNMKKPIYIGWRGEKSTEFDMGEDDDGELDIFVSKMSETISNGKYDCYDPDQFSEDIKTALYNEANDWGPVDAQTIINTVSSVARDYKVTTYNKFDDSVYAGTEIARDVFEQMGYDGFIDRTVSSKFREMDLDFETTHYIVFNSNQVKLTSNMDPTDSADITKHLCAGRG